MVKRIGIGLVVAILTLGWFGCTTDVELNAPYKSTTLVFGLMDPGLDTQWVKINRTWLGEGDNRIIATIKDSSEYQDDAFTGVINEVQNGVVLNSYPIFDTTLTNKEANGIFFGPEYKAYYIVTPDELSSESTYELELDFADKEDVFASTEVIELIPGTITRPPSGLTDPTINFAQVFSNNVSFSDYGFRWTVTENAVRYEANLIIYMNEYIYEDVEQTQLIEVVPKQLNWYLGEARALLGDNEITKEVSGESFFNFLANNLEENPRIRRELGTWDDVNSTIRAFDFILTIGDQDLDTYLNVNSPLTGVIQERPEYTNVSNGLGLFSSRVSTRVDGVSYTTNTMSALRLSSVTNELNFCSPDPFSAEFYCGE